ncbi:MAG: ferritin family protein [Candidatus Nitronauta litoralis]|uniref:Ferritin family protein n=1 Tax=Candidatus Nitronauta litoralis TaxID=2705533 RepID=A0A7T0BVK7_9BACT|nr:MAG: ferritin family protein [Candidatus Nitronauta litoralis]
MATSKSNISPSEINFQCGDAIQVCMAIEREGISFYEQAIKKARDPKVKDVFRRLGRDERDHSKALQAKWKHLQPAVGKRSPTNEEVNRFIQSEVKGRVFDLESLKGPGMQTDLEAVEFGITCEKRSIEVLGFLLEAERKIDVKAIFSHLLVEEKKHLSELEALKAELSI